MKSTNALFAMIAALFSAPTADAQLRPMIYAETTVEATPSETFSDWTTSEGVEAFLAPKADIDGKPGGRYEIHFMPDAPKGSRGNDEGRILAFQPGEMVSFTWAMPPSMPNIRPHLTTVQILFEAVDADTTRVRLFHTGFGTGEDWEAGWAYFANAWPFVLKNYKESKSISQP